MLKFFLRLFGSGRLPADGYRQIEPDWDPYIVQSLVVSVTYRNFRAPGGIRLGDASGFSDRWLFQRIGSSAIDSIRSS
jgi:hypothetical protein